MAAMSNYLELEVLDHVLSVGAYSMPADIYLGLSVGSMAEDASGTELSGSAYARQAIHSRLRVAGVLRRMRP